MLTPTHVLTGSALAKYALTTSLFPYSEWMMYSLGILASNMPDIDVLLFGIRPQHRIYSLLHKPLLWIIMFLIAIVLVLVGILPIPLPIIIFVFICILIHFLMDTFAVSFSIQWLWPWKKSDLHIFRTIHPKKTIKNRMHAYIRHPAFVVEILLIIGSICYLLI